MTVGAGPPGGRVGWETLAITYLSPARDANAFRVLRQVGMVGYQPEGLGVLSPSG